MGYDDGGNTALRPTAGMNGINSPSNAMTAMAQQRAASELQTKMVLAKQFPRDIIAVRAAIMNDCASPKLAETAVYEYARGGTNITGPSIRLAEAIARRYGNITSGVRELTRANGMSEMEASCWDLETNYSDVRVFQVAHIRYSKNAGNTELFDPRDIYEVGANEASRRLRACIMRVIPMDIFEEAVWNCEQTLSASADNSPEYVKKMMDSFAKIGVTKDMLQKRIQRNVEAITKQQVANLKKIALSIKDGMSTPADWFEMETIVVDEPKGTTSIKDKLKAKQSAPPATKDPFEDSGNGGAAENLFVDNNTDERVEVKQKCLDLLDAFSPKRKDEISQQVSEAAGCDGFSEMNLAQLKAALDTIKGLHAKEFPGAA